jgi:hypothetical protein
MEISGQLRLLNPRGNSPRYTLHSVKYSHMTSRIQVDISEESVASIFSVQKTNFSPVTFALGFSSL